MAPLPIKFQELLQLNSLGVSEKAITFNSCVRLMIPGIFPIPFTNLTTHSRH